MPTQATPITFTRTAPGDYAASDGGRIYRIPGLNPPAWNGYRPGPDGADDDLVDGAASLRDAKALYVAAASRG